MRSHHGCVDDALINAPATRASGLGDLDDCTMKTFLLVFDSVLPGEKLRQKMSWTKYHRLDTIHAYMRELEASHPKIVTVFSIGKTVEGRDLLGGGLQNEATRLI